jgi:hypothetical protein
MPKARAMPAASEPTSPIPMIPSVFWNSPLMFGTPAQLYATL